MLDKGVVVYGKPNCPYCDKAKRILDSNNVKYTYVDVSVDLEALEFIKGAGHKTVPQIYVDGIYHGESESAKTLKEV